MQFGGEQMFRENIRTPPPPRVAFSRELRVTFKFFLSS